MLLLQVLEDEARPPRQLNDKIPRDLETICLKAIAKSSQRRYQTAREFAEDLRRLLRGDPIQARSVGWLEKLGRWCRRYWGRTRRVRPVRRQGRRAGCGSRRFVGM